MAEVYHIRSIRHCGHYFIIQFCMVSNREQLLFESGVYILNLGQKMKKSELEENELVLEDC